MNTSTRPVSSPRGPALAMAIVLIALTVCFRLLRVTLLPELPNFSPIMALAVCGALVLPGRLALVIPLAALMVTDLVLNAYYHVALLGTGEFVRYACYGIGVATGLGLRNRAAGVPLTLGAVAGNSLLFYLVTNSASWFGNAAYPQTTAGWVQALTVGVPGFAPTWMFFGYSLLSDLLFTGAFLAVMYLATQTRRQEPMLVRA